MAVFLYRVGGFSFRRRRLVAGVWAVALIVQAIVFLVVRWWRRRGTQAATETA